MTRTWDPETSPAKVEEAIVGEVTTETDEGQVFVYVEHDTLGRGLVFMNLTDPSLTFLAIPFDSTTARELAALLVTAADKAEADKEEER
jgi:hypothetical protein